MVIRMIKRKTELKQVINENMRGGDGSVIISHLADAGEMYGKNRLFAEILIKPGCSIGYHIHENETEMFFIISGTALYDDNGTIYDLSPGDVSVTPSGQGHSIANNGNVDLELIALITLQTP